MNLGREALRISGEIDELTVAGALIVKHFECHKSLSAPPRNLPISPIGDGYH